MIFCSDWEGVRIFLSSDFGTDPSRGAQDDKLRRKKPV